MFKKWSIKINKSFHKGEFEQNFTENRNSHILVMETLIKEIMKKQTYFGFLIKKYFKFQIIIMA